MNIYLISAFLVSVVSILLLEKYALRKDPIPQLQPDFMKHDLYIFSPPYIDIGSGFLRDVESEGDETEEKYGKLHRLKIDDYAFTRFGDFLITKDTLDVFHENNLTGFQVSPVQNDESEIYCLSAMHTMPPFSNKTTLKLEFSPKKLVFDGTIFYDKEVLSNALDFNRSHESFGGNSRFLYSSYISQKYWILSNKAVHVLIHKIGVSQWNFVPVVLSDKAEDGEIKTSNNKNNKFKNESHKSILKN
ncbi:hypothetical protein [Methanolapillus millepedarum]